MNDEEMYNRLNNYLTRIDANNNIIINNSEFIMKLCDSFIKVDKSLRSYDTYDIKSFEYCSFNDIYDISKDIIKKLKFNIDLDKYINNGSVNLEYQEINPDDPYSINKEKLFNANVRTSKKVVTISSPLSAKVIDIPIFLHELIHAGNVRQDKEYESYNLFTESTSIFVEIYTSDYLEKIGYKNFNKNTMLRERIGDTTSRCAISLYTELELINLYLNMGDISKESYEMYNHKEIEKDYYDSMINHFKKFLLRNDSLILTRKFAYVIGTLLALYMYQEYEKDNNFIDKINKFYINMNDKTISELLSYIDLDINNKDIINILKEPLEEACNDLLSEDNYTKSV